MQRTQASAPSLSAPIDWREVVLPDPESEVLPGVQWGEPQHFFTPAFWFKRAWEHAELGTYGAYGERQSLVAEYAHCMLGGHGMPAEVGWAAAERVIASGILRTSAPAAEYEQLLRAPLNIGGRLVHYRFPSRKAAQLCAGSPSVALLERRDLDDVALRMELLNIPGVGPKTASWIVRNHRMSDAVAIIDIHISRAGKRIGLFAEAAEPSRNYFSMERAFLKFAEAIQVRASFLDHMMWNIMRRIRLTA